MTQIELIDRLCAVNTLLTDIVREQAEIMAQHGIEAIQTQDEATDRLDDLFGKRKRAEDENDAIEAANQYTQQKREEGHTGRSQRGCNDPDQTGKHSEYYD